jgi:hypothetical protein
MKGMIALRKLLTLLLAVLLLCGCSAVSPATEPPETTASVITEPPTIANKPIRKIVDYDPDGDPIYEDELVIPEPTKYDEYGALYHLVEGTLDEYYMDEEYWEEVDTPESTAFTRIEYHHFYSELMVQFRNSGAWYIYYDVEPEVWDRFKHAESKGGFFNAFIKGYYEYERY